MLRTVRCTRLIVIAVIIPNSLSAFLGEKSHDNPSTHTTGCYSRRYHPLAYRLNGHVSYSTPKLTQIRFARLDHHLKPVHYFVRT